MNKKTNKKYIYICQDKVSTQNACCKSSSGFLAARIKRKERGSVSLYAKGQKVSHK